MGWAFSTVFAPKIEEHAGSFRKYCPEKVYISMVVAYPTKWTKILLQPEEQSKKVLKDSGGVQQVVINVGDHNFGNIFPKDHVEFIDRLKNAGKRTANESGSDDESCSKRHRGDRRKINNAGKRAINEGGRGDQNSSEEQSSGLSV